MFFAIHRGSSAGYFTLGKATTGQISFKNNNTDQTSGNNNDLPNSGSPYRLITVEKDYTTERKIYLNSALRNTATNAAAFASNGLAAIGGRPDSAWTMSFNWLGFVCEIIIYSAILTSAQKAAVENYLVAKYAIS